MGLNKGKIISREALVEEVGLKMLPEGYYGWTDFYLIRKRVSKSSIHSRVGAT